MVDLMEQESEADGQLAKFGVKADGQVEDAYVFEADVVFVIQDTASARVLEKLVPGAVEVFERALNEDDNWKFRTTVNPDIKGGVKAMLSHASRGKVAMEGGADVKSVRVAASKKAVTATVKLAFGGQTASKAAALTELLRASCALHVEMQQQSMFAGRPATGGRAPSKGDAVVAWSTDTAYVGRVIEVTDQGVISLEDFDNTYSVEPEEVTAVIRLEGDVTAMRRSYMTRCKRREIVPTWEAIVMAAAQTTEGLLNGGEIKLTAEILETAVALLQSGDASVPEPLPPEAEVASG